MRWWDFSKGDTMFKVCDVVVCKDTTGPTILLVDVGQEYVIEKILDRCYIKLEGIHQPQKMWRFELKEK